MSNRDFALTTELRGLALPAIRGTGGYFESKTPFDVAWGDLLMALLVPQGSRPMDRSFGSTLYEILFSPLTLEFEVAEVAIRDAANRLLPHIDIRRVTVNSQESAKRVRVGVVFRLVTDRETEDERSVIVDKTFLSVQAKV